MADDTLLTISQIAADPTMRQRVAAGYAKEKAGAESAGAEGWSYSTAYWWASAPGWAAAVDYWRLVNETQDGWQTDPAVISDGMILAQVDLMLKPPDVPDNELPE